MAVTLSAYAGPIVIVNGSYAPSDVYAADLANDLELYAVTAAGIVSDPLDNPVRPADSVALRMKLVATGNPDAVDFVNIVGTTIGGVAADIDVDIDSGAGTYYSLEYWETITEISATKNSTAWSLAIYQERWGVISKFEQGEVDAYAHHVDVEIGDGNDVTDYTHLHGIQFWDSNARLDVKVLGTWQTGQLEGEGHSTYGCTVAINGNTPFFPTNTTGTQLNYATQFIFDNALSVLGIGGSGNGITQINKDCSIVSSTPTNTNLNIYESTITDMYVSGVEIVSVLMGAVIESIRIAEADWAIQLTSPEDGVIINNVEVIHYDTGDYKINQFLRDSITIFRSSTYPVAPSVFSPVRTAWAYFQYNLSVLIHDTDGSGLVGATVEVYDKDSNKVTDRLTDASGVFSAEEWVLSYQETGTGGGGTSEYKGPFVIKVLKSGYITYTIENVTIQDDIHIEAQLKQIGDRLLTHPGMDGGMRG